MILSTSSAAFDPRNPAPLHCADCWLSVKDRYAELDDQATTEWLMLMARDSHSSLAAEVAECIEANESVVLGLSIAGNVSVVS